jgi:hypothetical protein
MLDCSRICSIANRASFNKKLTRNSALFRAVGSVAVFRHSRCELFQGQARPGGHYRDNDQPKWHGYMVLSRALEVCPAPERKRGVRQHAKS